VRYEGWAAWCLRHRLATLSATAVFFFGSFALVPLLPTGFLPAGRPLADAGATSRCRPAQTLAETRAAAERRAPSSMPTRT
jgi:multidrug efflux pump subunit AcrB